MKVTTLSQYTLMDTRQRPMLRPVQSDRRQYSAQCHFLNVFIPEGSIR
jgi:hypothetical protein